MPEITNHIACPNCRHEWTLDEVRLQECDECGYPYHASPQVINEAFGDSEFDPDYIGPDPVKALAWIRVAHEINRWMLQQQRDAITLA